MAPQVLKFQDKDEKKKEVLNTIKEGTVSKIKTEVRTKPSQDPILIKKEDMKTTTKVVKRNYNLNKLSQVRKMVFKNKAVAPTNVTHHTNDIVVKYSPAVFKNAVEAVTEKWQEGAKYESEKLKLEVVKRRTAVDQSGVKVDILLVFRMSSKQGSTAKINQTIHIYNTTHSLMIQGARLLNGVKGFKCFLEDFLQSELEKEYKKKKDEIEKTEDLLDNVKLPVPQKEKKEPNLNKTSREFKFNCEMCEARFRTSEALKEHEERKHFESKEKTQPIVSSVVIEIELSCDECEEKFTTIKCLEEHDDKVHRKKDIACKGCDKKFQDTSIALKHVLLEHEETDTDIEVEVICDKCEEKFTTIKCLEEHDNKVHDKKEIACEVCDKKFQDKSIALKHMLLEHKENHLDTEKESERVVNMVRSITEKIIDNVETSEEDGEKKEMSELKRAHSVSPPNKVQTSKREKKEQTSENTDNKVDIKTSNDELANVYQEENLFKEDLTLMREKNTPLQIELLEKEEDIRLLKEENNELKKKEKDMHVLKEENNELKKKVNKHKEDLKKVEDDAMEVVLKVSESLRGDIEKKKEEVQGAWKEFKKLKKEQEEKYKVLVDENVKIGKEMAKMQEEKDLAQAKVESFEAIDKAKKYEANLKQFIQEFPAGCSTSTQDDAMDTGETVNECVKISSCIGDCDNLKLDHIRRLKELKDSGSNRKSPQVQPENKPQNQPTTKTTFKCKHCNFISEIKNELEVHIKNTHKCNCTMCGGTERNMTNMDHHYRNFPERRELRTKGPCRYHNQTGGCKKGDQCDFDHQGRQVLKIPKLCKNGRSCTWKPCCKFIHQEDGDQMPDQINRELRTPERRQNLNPMNHQQRLSSPQNLRNHHQQLNFQQEDFSRPPPGASQEPAVRVREDLKKWSLMSLRDFPTIARKEGTRH